MKTILSILVVCLLSFSLYAQCGVSSEQQLGKTQEASYKSKVLVKTLKSTNFKNKTFEKMVLHPKRDTHKVSAKKMSKKLSCSELSIDGFYVLTVQNSNPINKHIIFLHGGAYVAEATAGHRYLMEKLALDYNFKVTFIDYPLAPEHPAKDVHALIEKAFKIISDTHADDEFYLLGDSAGGGLALAFLQVLRSKNSFPMPRKTVLLSPWLDAGMSNPEIEKQADKDVILPVEGLKKCAKLYAGELDLKDPLVSPLFGSMDQLGNIKIFVSNHELFYPDCILLNTMMTEARGTSVRLSVYDNMMHDWVIFPIRERNETICEIAEFYLQDKV